MTKMAATPIYGKNPSKIFFSRTAGPIFTKLGMYYRGLQPIINCSNDDPGVTLTYFTARSNLVCYVPGVTRKELGNQIMTNYYSQESQQQALLKFNNLLRNDKIINYQKQWKICTIKESLVYSTLILSPNCPSELTHTNPSTVSDPQISKIL